jgi:hypothetical protein
VSDEQFNLGQLREFVREYADDLRYISEHPEIIDEWTPAQRAWAMEHLELNLEELKDLQVKIKDLLDSRGYGK